MASYHSAANEGALVEALGASLGAMSFWAVLIRLSPTRTCRVRQRAWGPSRKYADESACAGSHIRIQDKKLLCNWVGLRAV